MSASRQSRNEPLRLVHHHAGYLRARANAFIKTEEKNAAAAAARAAAESMRGFRGFKHNPTTGSIIVEYHPGITSSDQILERMAQAAGFQGITLEEKGTHIVRREVVHAIVDGVKSVNRIVAEETEGRVDLREVIPAALAMTSLASFVLNPDRHRLPRWDNALFWCYRIFVDSHGGDVS